MPQRRIKTGFKKSFPQLAILLVKIILIKIGSIPFSVVKITIDKLITIVISLSKLRLPDFHLFQFTRQPRKIGRPKKFRFSKRTKLALALSLSLIFILGYTFFILTAAYQLPTPTRLSNLNQGLTTEFYDKNGNLLYRLYEGRNRTLVNLSDIPKELVEATIATEDQNFYHHIGIDPLAIARAFYKNSKNQTEEGASTITQQLIKNSLLSSEKSYIRKIREAILALWAERIYTKDQILQMYFNETPYGGNVVGIGAAAETYFDKSPSRLTLAESAYLAGLPASPTQFSPYGTTPNLAKLRQREVLSRMVKEKYITKEQADAAYKEELKIRPQINNIVAPHFVFYLRDLLIKKYGQRVVTQGGLKVYTSLDLKIQKEAEEIVKNEVEKLEPLNVKNGAAIVMDTQTGQILAMVGSRDYHYPNFGNYNVTLSLRQPGSSVKPITYAVAFEKGMSPAGLILDIPVTFKDEWGNAYTPVNYDGIFHGPVTLRQALGSSLNIPAVKLLATVGIDSFAKKASDLGITTFDNPKRFGLSLTLGGGDIRMIEMMGVYGAFSQKGQYLKPTGILKVTDSLGNVLEEYGLSPKQTITPQVAYLITNILADDDARKMAFGTNSLLNIPGFEVAVKTGTSDKKRDNWTFGYTPKFVVGVWVGNPDNSPMDPTLASGVTGAAPIWNKIMHALLDGTEALAFERPAGIADSEVAGKKDIRITGMLPKAMVKVRKSEDKIVFSDAFSSIATTSAQPEGADQANQAQPNL